MKKKGLSLTFFVLICFTTIFSGCDKKAESIYADEANWAYYAIGEEKAADLFLICPTVDMGKDDNYNMSMSDEKTKENFIGALNMERGIYEESATLYAPYYRQVSFPVYNLSAKEAEPYFEIAYSDVKDAFVYYMENINSGKPLILAGFSQGSDMLLRLMKDVFSNETYQKQLIAAYCIGWRVTEEDLASCPWLHMAQGETDTGVIVSFNTESKETNESLMVPNGVKSLGINPLNWKTDNTPADSSENIGACFTDYSGKIEKEINNLTGAYLDENRGTLKVTDITPEDYSSSIFPDGVYHIYDYQFFYRNLQQNVSKRCESYSKI